MKLKKIYLIVLALLTVFAGMGQEVKKVKIGELEKIIADSKTPLIVNFWATFCKPCIEEIPYFQKLVKAHEKDKAQLLLVSMDMSDDYPKIAPFAIKRNFTSPIIWLNESNADYFCPRIDAKWSGGIPATLFVNNKKGIKKFVEDQLSEERLEKEIVEMLR